MLRGVVSMTEDEMKEELQLQTDLLNLCLKYVCDSIPSYDLKGYKYDLQYALLSYLEHKPDSETKHFVELLNNRLIAYDLMFVRMECKQNNSDTDTK